jgi:polyisoprenoid-binding protein YceI
MKKTKLIALLFFYSLTALQVYSQVINSKASVVNFSISNMKFKTVVGSFKGMQGTVIFEVENLNKSTMNVCIDASTVNTESKMRDEHLQNEDFFFVEKYPNICFTSSKFTKTDEGYIVYGDLNMHGEKREISIPFTYNKSTFKGSLSLNRLDYNLGPNASFMVGERVDLEIICELQ